MSNSVPVGIASPLLDHKQRLEIARALAKSQYDSAEQADGILAAYFQPTSGSTVELTSYDVCIHAAAEAENTGEIPADIVSELSDHEQRMVRARDHAYYQLGQESCADDIVGVYFTPSKAVVAITV
jgi:hypothetical protein